MKLEFKKKILFHFVTIKELVCIITEVKSIHFSKIQLLIKLKNNFIFILYLLCKLSIFADFKIEIDIKIKTS
jgi:hypothetical protein